MFPSIITTFPIVSATDRLNNPSHSALENLQSSTLGQLQAVIGLSTSSALGTLYYDVRSPDSNGGGHIQTANKGGTGQTTYLKGDLLVATSTSVLTKLAVSSTAGEVLVVDPNTATGLKYAAVIANKVAVKVSPTLITAGPGSVMNVLFSSSIIGSTLGTNNAIRYTGTIDAFNMASGNSLVIEVQYGNKSVAGATLTPSGVTPNLKGTIQGMIVSNGGVTDQKGYFTFSATNGLAGGAAGTASVIQFYNLGSSSVNSSANQDLIINAQMSTSGGGVANSIIGTIFTVEKIV